MSERRGCAALRFHRSLQRYRSCRDDQAPLRLRIREIAAVRVRYGYPRIHILLRREGWAVNRKRVYRLYRQEGLSLRHKRPKRHVMAARRSEWPVAMRPNEQWSMDFVSDALFDGRRIRALTLVDNYTREALAIVVDSGIRGEHVVETGGGRRAAWCTGPHPLRQRPISGSSVAGWTASLLRQFALAAGRPSTQNQAASTVMGELSAIANTGSLGGAPAGAATALTVLETRCRPRWKTRTLSTGLRLRPHGSDREGFFHLAPAPRRRAGNRHRS